MALQSIARKSTSVNKNISQVSNILWQDSCYTERNCGGDISVFFALSCMDGKGNLSRFRLCKQAAVSCQRYKSMLTTPFPMWYSLVVMALSLFLSPTIIRSSKPASMAGKSCSVLQNPLSTLYYLSALFCILKYFISPLHQRCK